MGGFYPAIGSIRNQNPAGTAPLADNLRPIWHVYTDVVTAAFRAAAVASLVLTGALLWPLGLQGQRGAGGGGQAAGSPNGGGLGQRQGDAGDAGGAGNQGGRGFGQFLRGRGELPAGTSAIRGRVTSDTGAPVRRAQVRASFSGRPGGRAVSTDVDGRFELRDLPAGQWALSASKAGFVTQRYGQRRALETVPPIQLAEGQRLDGANFTLARGGAISGRVQDDFGDAVANVRVQVQRSQMVDGRRRMMNIGVGDETDDTGAFRLYGLAPGDYYVSATPRTNPIESSGDGAGYAPTYYPGTGNAAEAQRLSVGAGEELAIGFSLLPVRMVRISGVVVSAGGGAPGNGGRGAGRGGLVMLTNSGDAGEGVLTSMAGPVQADGSFTIANVPPGSYVLNVRSGGARNINQGVLEAVEIGSLPITVSDGDVTGVTIVTARGASIAGTIVTDGAASLNLTSLRVTTRQLRNTFGGGPGGTVSSVSAAGAFQLSSLSGPTVIRVEGLPAQWMLKSVVVGAVDVTDAALDLKGTEQVTNARIVITDRVAEVNGGASVGNQSAKDFSVVVFAADASLWAFPTRFVRTARANEQGQFTIRGLPAAGYLAAAVSYIEDGESQDPEFLERLRESAARVTVREGETKTLALRLIER